MQKILILLVAMVAMVEMGPMVNATTALLLLALGLAVFGITRRLLTMTSTRTSSIPSALTSGPKCLDQIFVRVFHTTSSYPRAQAAVLLHRARFLSKKIMDGRYECGREGHD